MDRPTGVTILAILAFLNGLLAILGAITVMYLGIGTGLGIIGIFILALGILSIIYGWGLWTLKSWAWILAIIGSVLGLIANIAAAVSSGDYSSNLLSAIINAIIVWYLFRPEVKAAFGR
jgi:uncharacterized membrane protein (DUF2068 family)